MTTVRNIWMICLEFNWFVYDRSWMLHLSEFVWTLRFSPWVVFNHFLQQIDRKRLFFAVSLYPLSFFANTPFKVNHVTYYSTIRNRCNLRYMSTYCKFYGISYNPIFIAGWHQKSYIDPDSFEKHQFLRLGLIQIFPTTLTETFL